MTVLFLSLSAAHRYRGQEDRISGAEGEDVVRTAVPLPDLTIIDEALAAGPERLRAQKCYVGDGDRLVGVYLTIAQLLVAQLR